jgi:hypothetical protein
MEEKTEINHIFKYIEQSNFLLLSLLFIVILLISINYNIYSNYTINLFNNLYFKFALFLIVIHIVTENIIIALILVILLLFILQKVSIHNINNDFNSD